MANIPSDPIMLLSYVNTMLRDRFGSFEELCDSLGLDKAEIEKKLSDAGFIYMPQTNQFR